MSIALAHMVEQLQQRMGRAEAAIADLTAQNAALLQALEQMKARPAEPAPRVPERSRNGQSERR